MKVYEILNDLTYGELSQYKLGGLRSGGMADEDLPRVMSLINRGIRAINTRLDLLKHLAIVRLNEDRAIYPMRVEHSVYSGSALVGDKFIMDTVDTPFPSNFKKFIQLSNSNGEPILLNNRYLDNSFAIPMFDTFQMTNVIQDDLLYVEFSYDVNKLVAVTINDTKSIEYPLPSATSSALCAYVAMKMTENLSSAENKQEQQVLMGIYDSEIKLLQDQDLLVGDVINSPKFYRDGWI